jgi:hypothetical protein
MKWTAQSPHRHSRTPQRYRNKGLGDHNYCRNPDLGAKTIWCYTTDKGKRWEECAPMTVTITRRSTRRTVTSRSRMKMIPGGMIRMGGGFRMGGGMTRTTTSTSRTSSMPPMMKMGGFGGFKMGGMTSTTTHFRRAVPFKLSFSMGSA